VPRQEALLCAEQSYHEVFTRYARYFAPGRLVFLRGDLGAGKTTFVRTVCTELEVADLVSSPSFAIANVYRAPSFRVAHLDLFRLDEVRQLEDIGALDFLDERTLVFVEWPENCEGFFPQADLEISFGFADSEGDALDPPPRSPRDAREVPGENLPSARRGEVPVGAQVRRLCFREAR